MMSISLDAGVAAPHAHRDRAVGPAKSLAWRRRPVRKSKAFNYLRSHCSPLILASIALPFAAAPAAQETGNSGSESINDTIMEEIVVSATRRALQNALDIKRNTTAIVDVLSAGDIGDIPSLSVAEALEGITGASAHRLKGSGSQVSIRGLGPFLGFSTFNGREVTTGSADRAVNFQQFPAELINTITIYKTQQADLVEGGTSGIVELQSIRPLDYGKEAMSVEFRGKYNSHAARVDGNDGIGARGSFTFVDQFDTDAGRLGVSFGYARFDSGNPEESYLTSSSFQLCDARVDRGSSRCQAYDQQDQADDLAAGDDSAELYFVPNSISYRTQDEEEKRDAIISTIQWVPNDQWEINADVQWSSKYYEEDRHDFTIDDARREHSNVSARDNYGLLNYSGVSRGRVTGELYRRDEDYRGGGLNLTWRPSDTLALTTDLSFANTQRDRVRRVARFRSDYFAYNYTANSLVPSITFDTTMDESPAGTTLDTSFDVSDLASFGRSGDADLRSRLTNREDDIWALRLDGEYRLDIGFVDSVKAGVRYSERQRITNNEDTRTMRYDEINEVYWGGTSSRDELMALAQNTCANSRFPNDDFFGSDDGGPNVGGSFATFDTLCVIRTLTRGDNRSLPDEDRRGTNDIDVTEEITAAYVMANFSTELGAMPLSGNFGLRVVQTDVTSLGLRGTFDVVEDNTDPANPTYRVEAGDDFTRVKFTNSTTEYLPSVNAIFQLREDILLRTAAYRAMSRDNIELLGAGRSFGNIDEDQDYASPEEALQGELDTASGGNPDLEPLMSWNADLSLEWYLNEDTAVSAAVYYKSFEAATFPSIVDETIVVNGVDVAVATTKIVNVDDKSDLLGFELTAQHAFTSLPQPFDGLGVKLTYNYADTNFETQDPILGDALQSDGSVLPGLAELEPASIFGLSEHTGSLKLYWDIGRFHVSAITKYRSEYFQPNAGTPRANRWIDDFTLLDLAASYRVNDTWKLRATVQNLLDEPQSGQRGARSGSTTLWSSTGPKFELSVNGSF